MIWIGIGLLLAAMVGKGWIAVAVLRRLPERPMRSFHVAVVLTFVIALLFVDALWLGIWVYIALH